MATLTSTATTILRLTGAAEYAAGMTAAARATRLLAVQSSAVNQATNLVGKTLTAQNIVTLAITAGLTAMTAAVALAGKALKTFAEDQQVLLRAAVTLRNLGANIPFSEIRAFADQMARLTGVDDEAVVGLEALLIQLGLTKDQMRAAIPIIIDTALATHKGFTETADAFVRATRGRTGALIELGINLQTVRGHVLSFATVLDAARRSYQGFAELSLKTPEGALLNFTERLSDLFSAIGQQLAPQVVTILNAAAQVVVFLTEHVQILVAAVEGVLSFLQPFMLLLRLVPGTAQPDPNQIAAGSAVAGGRAALGHLAAIEENTRKTHDAITRQILGGGPVARAAINIRGLNEALRTVR